MADSLGCPRQFQPEDQFSESERLAIKLRIEHKRKCILLFHLFLALMGVLAILLNSIQVSLFLIRQTEINHNRFWNYDHSLEQSASSRDKQIARFMALSCSLTCLAMCRPSLSLIIVGLNSLRFGLSLCLLREIDHKVLLNARTCNSCLFLSVIRKSQKVERLPDPQYYRHKGTPIVSLLRGHQR